MLRVTTLPLPSTTRPPNKHHHKAGSQLGVSCPFRWRSATGAALTFEMAYYTPRVDGSATDLIVVQVTRTHS